MTIKSGKLGAADLAAETDTVLYHCGEDNEAVAATVTVALCNRSDDPAKVRLSASAADVPTDAEFLEFDTIVPARGGVLERTGIVVGAGERIVVRASVAGVCARAQGFEK